MAQQAGSAADVSTAPILTARPQPKRMLMHALISRLHTLPHPASLFACSACCSLTATTVCARAVGAILAARSNPILQDSDQSYIPNYLMLQADSDNESSESESEGQQRRPPVPINICVKPELRSVLDPFANSLQGDPVARISVIGHTDSTGSTAAIAWR